MKDRKNQTTKNNEVNLQSDALTDLPVADEQANQTKAGAANQMGGYFLARTSEYFVADHKLSHPRPAR